MIAKILVYTDKRGASEECVSWTIDSVSQCLDSMGCSRQYTVDTTTASQLSFGDWKRETKLLIMPGGRDLPYVEALTGRPNQMIKEFVASGGAYLGLCAGGYYGASEVEFEKDDPVLQVCGSRELQFFPGKARGTILPGFQYKSYKGAHCITIQTANGSEAITPTITNSTINVYYQGGCEFVPNTDCSEKPYNVVASYLNCDQCQSGYAIVNCNHGNGRVVLSGVHIEADPAALSNVAQLVPPIMLTDLSRRQLLASIIKYLLRI